MRRSDSSPPSRLLACLLAMALLLLLGADAGERATRAKPTGLATHQGPDGQALARRVEIQRLRLAGRVSLEDPNCGLPALMNLALGAQDEDVRQRAGSLLLDGVTRHPMVQVDGLDGALRHLWITQKSRQQRQRSLILLLAHGEPVLPPGAKGTFLATLLPAVLDSSRAHRLPPSVALGQAIHESGWGQSRLARQHHNLFGVKSGAQQGGVVLPTTEQVGADTVRLRSRFRSYSGIAGSIEQHAELLGEDRRYEEARARWSDWRAFLAQVAPRYATDPEYAQRVTAIVERYRLDRWDDLVREAARWDADRPIPPSLASSPRTHEP